MSGKFCPVHIVRFILFGYILCGIYCPVYFVRVRFVRYILSGMFCPVCFVRVYFVRVYFVRVYFVWVYFVRVYFVQPRHTVLACSYCGASINLFISRGSFPRCIGPPQRQRWVFVIRVFTGHTLCTLLYILYPLYLDIVSSVLRHCTLCTTTSFSLYPDTAA